MASNTQTMFKYLQLSLSKFLKLGCKQSSCILYFLASYFIAVLLLSLSLFFHAFDLLEKSLYLQKSLYSTLNFLLTYGFVWCLPLYLVFYIKLFCVGLSLLMVLRCHQLRMPRARTWADPTDISLIKANDVAGLNLVVLIMIAGCSSATIMIEL